jgi:glutamate-1-semialdehyde 2,1-aminomutase
VNGQPGGVDAGRLQQLLDRERAAFAAARPISYREYQRARTSLFGGVPMTWMNKAAGGFPIFLDRA